MPRPSLGDDVLDQARALIEAGHPIKEVAATVGISKNAIYKHLDPNIFRAAKVNRREQREEQIKERVRELLSAGHTFPEAAAIMELTEAYIRNLTGGIRGLFGDAHERNTVGYSEHGTRTKPRGYIKHWFPRKETREIIKNVQRVLEEYDEHLPLTLRQIFYRLVGVYNFPKTENAYAALSHKVTNARRAGWIGFSAIRDDGTMMYRTRSFYSVEHFYRSLHRLGENYRKNLMVNQDVHVEVSCEAAGMLGQLALVADPFCVACYSSGGTDSVTEKKNLANRIAQADKDAIILHLGDYDPSGESIFDVLSEDVTKFLEVDAPHLNVEFRRVALTREQVEEYELPTAPPKSTDTKAKNWESNQTCQLEALPPNIIADLLREAIEDVLDLDQLEQDREAEEAERDKIVRKLAKLGASR